jgi:purine nucleosidase
MDMTIAEAICKAAGKRIHIHAGADHTMMPSSMYPTPDGAIKLSNWEHETFFRKNQAIDFMRKTIRDNPHEISLLAIGHLKILLFFF